MPTTRHWRHILTTLWRALAASPRSPWQQTRDLRELDDRLLADIGVTRAEARWAVRRGAATRPRPATRSRHRSLGSRAWPA